MIELQQIYQHLQVLGLAFRCLIVSCHDTAREIAANVANSIQARYHTLVCHLRGMQHHALNTLGEESSMLCACTSVVTDVCAVEALLPVSHAVLLVETTSQTMGQQIEQLLTKAVEHGCHVLVLKPSSRQFEYESKSKEIQHGTTISIKETGDGFVLEQEQWHKIYRTVGISDAALSAFSVQSLQAMKLDRHLTHMYETEVPREPIDLATFNIPQLTRVWLTVKNVTAGAIAHPMKSERKQSKTLSPDSDSGTDIAMASICLDIAKTLLSTNKCLTVLDLTSASIGVDGARLLASATPSSCRLSQLLFMSFPLPVAAVLGNAPSTRKDSTKFLLDLPGPKIVAEDLAYLACLLNNLGSLESIDAVIIRGQTAVPDDILDEFAATISKASSICTIQGIPRQQMEAATGCLSFAGMQTPAAHGTDVEHHLGMFAVLAAAQILHSSVQHRCKPYEDYTMFHDVNANTMDGIPPSTRTNPPALPALPPFHTIDLAGVTCSSYGVTKIVEAVHIRGTQPSLDLKLAGTVPDFQACHVWARAVTAQLGASLTALDMSRNKLNDDALEAIAPMFQQCTSVRLNCLMHRWSQCSPMKVNAIG